MPRKRRSFSREFKENAVTELEQTGATLADVASRLGVSISNLSQWRTQFAAKARGKAEPAAAASSKEIAVLLKEIAQLKEERDTLRKALSYLAKDL
jgi:transposase